MKLKIDLGAFNAIRPEMQWTYSPAAGARTQHMV